MTCPMECELYMYFILYFTGIWWHSFHIFYLSPRGKERFVIRDFVEKIFAVSPVLTVMQHEILICKCASVMSLMEWIQGELSSRHVDGLMQDCCISSASALKMKYSSLAQGVQQSGKVKEIQEQAKVRAKSGNLNIGQGNTEFWGKSGFFFF